MTLNRSPFLPGFSSSMFSLGPFLFHDEANFGFSKRCYIKIMSATLIVANSCTNTCLHCMYVSILCSAVNWLLSACPADGDGLPLVGAAGSGTLTVLPL